ncbi:MAG: diaminopimelate epimerase [Granulosicoccus sp.]
MHGLGNDFMVIDNLDGRVHLDGDTVRRWSDRHTGIGFDQLLVVNTPTVNEAEFDYQIFNADGDEVEHCGNGARCFARFVTDRQLTQNRSIKVNTALGIITLQLQDDEQVTVKMGVPQFEPALIPFVADQRSDFYELDVDGHKFAVGSASIGNPHVLFRVDDLRVADVERIGQLVERHPRFPNRVNVGFMQTMGRQHIRLRVFERGVGETRACGTGACAAVAIAHSQGLLDKTAIVSLPGGDLKIHWPNVKASIEMTGPCSTVFEGQTRI